jgi:hypothetical protein
MESKNLLSKHFLPIIKYLFPGTVMYIEYGFLYLTRPELTVQYATNQYLPSTRIKNATMDAAKDAGKNLSNVICSITGKLKGYRY